MHAPDHFYKFLSCERATEVITRGSVTYSAVDLWHDPFELSSFAQLNFSSAMFLDAAVNLTSSMIFGPDDPKGDAPLLNAINRWRHEGRFGSAEEAHTVLTDLLGNMVNHRWGHLQAMLGEWRKVSRNTRYCCFCAKLDTLSAWETYADGHRGLALRLEKSDTAPWRNARPVDYEADPAELTTLKEQLSGLIHNKEEKLTRSFSEHHYIRPAHRRAEREYRSEMTATESVAADREDIANWIEHREFKKEDLKAVYFGLAILPSTRKQLADLLSQHYPQTRLFQAIKGKSGYTLEFIRIKNPEA